LKTAKNRVPPPPVLRLLVLVPHRDARLPLRRWSASLFTASLPGAWSFPQAAPLALAGRPLSDDGLKRSARALRAIINDSGGKFTAGPPALTEISERAFIFGPELNVNLPGEFYESLDVPVISRFTPPLIGAALQYGPLPGGLPPPPEISFRAAALANMSFRPLPSNSGERDSYSFEWKIGPLHWLPKR